MDAWPTDHRPQKPTNNTRGKEKGNVKRNYPLLDAGIVDAATLVERDGKLEWDAIVVPKLARQKKRFRVTQKFEIFPPTKPCPEPEPSVPIDQRADHQAHYLRTHFPDAEVTSEIIREQVVQEVRQNQELAKFDAFQGNLIDIVVDYDGSTKRSYVAFPMGEINAELDITPLIVEENGNTTIKPNVIPRRTFSTPIQQITASSSTERQALLAIRTFGATSLLTIDHASTTQGGLLDVTHFTSHDVGGDSIMDVNLSPPPSPFEALLINKKGGIFGCSLSTGKKTMVKLHDGPVNSSTDQFWRIGSGSKPTECTILSEKILNQLDFRTNTANALYTENANDFLTSVEDYSQDNLFRLCTTFQILWIDPRFTGRPLLGYKHHRQFDRTLQTNTLFTGQTPITFLSSRKNGHITIYDVSRHTNDLIYVNDHPTALTLSPGSGKPHAGLTFLKHETGDIAIFKIDERLSVSCFDTCRNDHEMELPERMLLEENDDVKILREKGHVKTDLERFGDRDRHRTNLYPLYDHIFREYFEQQENVEEEQAEAVYDVLDRLPMFWQTVDGQIEHMLTTHDIAFRAHEEPKDAARSDFLTGSLFNSTRGCRALSQGRLPFEDLRKSIPWHINISDIYNRIDPSLDLNADMSTMIDSLREYDLEEDSERSALSMRRENQAREQLATDLTLSRDVYSGIPFVKAREKDVGDDLETMTEALSLGGHGADKPPEVEFGYLRPFSKPKNGHYKKDEKESKSREDEDNKVSLPMGVRCLLQDWEVGTKVKDYMFTDPYNTTGEGGTNPSQSLTNKRRIRSSMQNILQQSVPMTQSQQPPPILRAQPIASTQPQRPRAAPQSQDVLGPVGDLGQSQLESQQYMASTQVLPGPHGGRPSMTMKKKGAKKRLGGF